MLWDGLKGYITNTNLPMEEVISQYHGLWVVERAFRIGKGTLEMRPMFHFTDKRIEAHICICFVAYKVYKELERKMRTLGVGMSVDKLLSIAKTVTTLRIKLPNGEVYAETLYTTPQQEAIKPLIEALAHSAHACESLSKSGKCGLWGQIIYFFTTFGPEFCIYGFR